MNIQVQQREALEKIKNKLKDRVEAAYVFGSAATGKMTAESDIDLILVVKNPKLPFVQRGFEFIDLFEIYPHLDILVYSAGELNRQLEDSNMGFWKSVKSSLREL